MDLVRDILPEPTKPTILPEHQKEIDKAVGIKPSGEEVGMWWKEVGALMRMWKMNPETQPKDKEGNTLPWARVLVEAYYAQMFTILPIEKGK